MSNTSFRILQVIPAFETGGVEQGTLDIAHALVKDNHQAFVVSEGGQMVDQLPTHSCTHITMDLNTKNPLKIINNSRRLKKLINDYNIDLVHARSRAPAWSAWIACKETHTPFITTFHSTYGFKNPLKRWYNSVMVRGQHIIAISKFIDQHIRKVYQSSFKIPNSNISIIHRCVDLEKFTPSNDLISRATTLKEQWKIPHDHQVIVLPGRIVRRKGHKCLLAALAKLSKRNWTCVFVGTFNPHSRYIKEIKELISRLGLETKIIFSGNCTDMPAVNQLADVIVVNSTVPEAFGRTMAEAGSLGTPVIASNLGAAPEIIEHGKTGWLIPPDDPESLARHLDSVLTLTQQQKEELRTHAQSRIRSLFSKDDMCKKTLEVYRQALAYRSQG